MSNPRERGEAAERLAENYLRERGLKLVERNFHSRKGEIDLVMQDGGHLIFVEVRLRRNDHFGSAAESITLTKQRRVINAASYFLQCRRQWRDSPCRFDVLTVSGRSHEEIGWIRDAFRQEG